MARVVGVGGVFFKCDDPQKQRQWYQEHLGLNTDAYGTNFVSRLESNPEIRSYLQWSPFQKDSSYFPGQMMVNYRVDNLEELLLELAASGITIVGEVQKEEYGLFAHVSDPEGNLIELWEPYEDEYDKIVEGRTF